MYMQIDTYINAIFFFQATLANLENWVTGRIPIKIRPYSDIRSQKETDLSLPCEISHTGLKAHINFSHTPGDTIPCWGSRVTMPSHCVEPHYISSSTTEQHVLFFLHCLQ